ncbi:uncharacterized protein zgc:113263 isoform X3 [Triplophysa rosa]|uniref:uncharacterized protein zgc:113263 isoform X3 n=1 Tax=Triplophysa rosa TaxID=992332 RepID=UPI002545C9D0|nr:uncharacterized protein zgc:113263 isoform X3 [Triplophysa rosa]
MEAPWTKKTEDPLSLMRFTVPPLRLLSAAMWQVTEQRQVKHYGMLEEFVTMVTETVPELLNFRQRVQLILGLRARLLLELCRSEHQLDPEDLQSHLDRIRAPRVNNALIEVVDEDMEESEASFVDLAQTLISNPVEREHFFQNIFPVEYGPKFDKALHRLMKDFLIQLDRMMSVPDLSQMVSWFRAHPSLLEECIQSISIPKQMKNLLERQRANGHILENETLRSAHDNFIFSSLSLPPLVRVVIPSDHAESGDPSESGIDSQDDCPSSKTLSDPSTSDWKAEKWKIKTEADEQMERDVDEDDDQNLSVKSERGTRAHCKGKRKIYEDSPGEEMNQTRTKKPSVRSCKRKRDDNVEASGAFTFINHLGAYTEEASYQTSDASKVPWSDEETHGLIDIWGKDSVQRSLKDCARNRHIFNLISKKMYDTGFARTAEQCHTRIKRLKMTFRQCHENVKGGEKPEWKFYNQLEKIMCGKHSSTDQDDSINPTETIPEESSGQQEDEDTHDWEIQGHAGLEGTRNVLWTDLETQTLIKIWGEDRTQRELRGVLQNGHIFAMISKKMAAHGYIRTAEQCQSRIKRLKLCFKQCYENNLSSTEGKESVEFKFYKQMERILGNEESNHTQLPEMPISAEIKEEESTDIEYQEYKYQETAMNCMDDRKKVAWSDAETLILLQLWGDEQVQMNLQRCPHNGHIYAEISEKLNAYGYSRSAEQCQTRIKRLKISYRQCRDSIGLSEAERVELKFYDLMEDIFRKNFSSDASGASDQEPNNSSIKSAEFLSELSDPCSSSDQAASEPWSDSETDALIEVWAEDEMQEALRDSGHNVHVFADIAEKLNSHGFLKTPEQCRWKIKTLRKHFRVCYERKQCGEEQDDDKFYDKLERLLADEAFSVEIFDDQEDQDAESQWSSVAVVESGRKMPWSDRETQALLEIWGEGRVQHSLKSCLKNRHIYRYISRRMLAQGFNRTGEQCHSRVKRLKAQFYYDREECKFYDQMEKIILKDGIGDEQAINELESLTDSDSESPALSKPLLGDGPKLAWGDSETRALISIWGNDQIQERLRCCVKRKPVFQQIAKAMAEKGYSRTDEQCRTRIKRLKASYRQCLDSPRNEGEQVEWKFFNQLKKIFDKYYPNSDETASNVTQDPETVGRKWSSRSTKAQNSA